MIKINLLPARKPKRQSEPGQKDVLVGMLALIVAAGVVFFLVDKPKRDDLSSAEAKTASDSADLQRFEKGKDQGEQVTREQKVKLLPDMRAELADTQAQADAIDKLIGARAVPAHMLHELGEILTPGRMPTMTKEMAQKVKTDPNFQFRDDWDPKHVWIITFKENKGAFTLDGGAESDADVTQLAKRMQASAYFQDVNPTGGQKQTDKDSGITYYTFTIQGKVVY